MHQSPLCDRHKQKECRAAQNRARLSIDTYQVPLGLARKDTPLQIGETPSIIEGTDLVNWIPNMEHGLTRKPIRLSNPSTDPQ
jgi:hypothetical protein